MINNISNINNQTIKKLMELLNYSQNIRVSRPVGSGLSLLIVDLLNEIEKYYDKILVVSERKILNEQFFHIISTHNNEFYKKLDFLIGSKIKFIVTNQLENELEIFQPSIIITNIIINDNVLSKSKYRIRKILDSYVLIRKYSKVIYFDSSLESINTINNVLNVIVRPQININYIDDYKEKLKKLFNNYGLLWDKLQDKSKTYLITAEILFSQLLNYGDEIDYSSVVLMWMKSLELELKKYFYTDLTEYLRLSDCKIDMYPQGLKDYFALGKLTYILKKNEYDKCRIYLDDYFLQISSYHKIEEIKNYLAILNRDVQVLTKQYRNKASHTGGLTLTDAIECYQMLIYIEKVFIRFLEFIK
jgi:hypothetical protein